MKTLLLLSIITLSFSVCRAQQKPNNDKSYTEYYLKWNINANKWDTASVSSYVLDNIKHTVTNYTFSITNSSIIPTSRIISYFTLSKSLPDSIYGDRWDTAFKSWFPQIKKCFYYSNNKLILNPGYSFNNNQWVLNGIDSSIYDYDINGNLTHWLEYLYDISNKNYRVIGNKYFLYNSDQSLASIQYYVWNSSLLKFVLNSKDSNFIWPLGFPKNYFDYRQTYNYMQNLTSYNWDTQNSLWLLSHKYANTFNGSYSKPIMNKEYSYNVTNGWTMIASDTSSYAGSYLAYTIHRKHPTSDSSIIYQKSKELYFYSFNFDMIQSIGQTYDTTNQVWKNSYQYYYDYSKIMIGLDEVNSKELNEITVYPSPASNHLNIAIKNLKSKNLTYQVFNITGKVVLSNSIQVEDKDISEAIDISMLNDGMYFIVLKNNNELLKQSRFIKN